MSDDKLVKGFNDGHLLEKYKPDMASKLYDSFADKEYDYALGFTSGVKTARKEKLKSRAKQINKNAPPKSKGRSKDRDRGIEKDY